MTKRALRRGYLAAMKKKARIIYPSDPKAKLANHLAACSWMCCSHGRRWHGPSIQEQRLINKNEIENE